MQYTQLGRTGLKVSRLCLGTMNFGGYISEAESFELMSRTLEHGINLFNLAEGPEHSSVEFLGHWLAEKKERRDEIVIAATVSGILDLPYQNGLSALSIRRTCETYLRRLNTDYIDLFQIAHIYRETPWDEIWQAMEQLVHEGKILYTGSANFPAWHIAQGNERARQRSFLGLVSEQSLYNLLQRTVELEVLPACQAYGMAALPWSPLAGGVLTGPPELQLQSEDKIRRSDPWSLESMKRHRLQLDAFEKLCHEIGHAPALVALAWLLHNPAITAPIIEPRTIEQLDQTIQVLEVHLSAETRSTLDEIFPGPGGPAPEAYAW